MGAKATNTPEWMHRRQARTGQQAAPGRWLGRAALAVLLTLWAGVPAFGQSLAPGAKLPGAAASPVPAEAPPAATAPQPARLRTVLLAIHGFSRAELDAASAEAPQILMGWIDDPAESHLIRRQALKALGLYPTEAVFAFLRDRLPEAPAGLRHLYVTDLQGHVPLRPQAVQEVVLPLLDSPLVVVRHAAVEVAGRMTGSGVVAVRLQERLAVEPDPAVKAAIERQLAP